MLKRPIPLILALLLAGCTIIDMDLTKVDPSDQIDSAEAVLIAQLRLGDSKYKNAKDFNRVAILASAASQKFPDYWFVTFPAKKFYVLDHNVYLVAVAKKTGQVVYASLVAPKKIDDLSWIAEYIEKEEGE